MLKQIGIVLIVSILGSFTGYSQGLVINEFMSSNGGTLTDSDGEYSDWIELYNAGDEAIDLGEYRLSDEPEEPEKWALPKIPLAANSFVVVFASGKNRSTGQELHSNFKMSSSGETLLLSKRDKIIDQIAPKALGEDQAYGRLLDGANNWWLLEMATPGTSNNESNQILFSHPAGFHKEPFNLSITSIEGYDLRYTLDGSVPTAASKLLEGPIAINKMEKVSDGISNIPTTKDGIWKRPKEGVDKFTTLRCAGFYKTERRTKVYTKSYIVNKDLRQGYHLPIISLVTDSLSLFDHDSGIYVTGKFFNTENPEWTGNFFKKGIDWERDVHIEYYEKDGTLGFAQDAGMRIHGGRSRHYAQKSLRLYAREEYGVSKFNYPLLPQKDEEDYKRFLLRSTMGAWHGQSIFKDAFVHQTVRDLDLEYQDYRPVVVYINGEYWGIHTVRDRIDTRFLEYMTGANKDSIDFIEGNHRLVSAGSNDHYVQLINFIDSNSLAEDANYQYVSTQMDVSNYIDYQIAQMFYDNIDWPSNNVKLWRPQREGGKWRWIFFDLDASCGSLNHDMFEHTTLNDPDVSYPNGPVSTYLFRNLLLNKGFEERFIERYAEILNKHLTSNNIADKFYEAKRQYDPEVERHVFRWSNPTSLADWEYSLSDRLLPFISERPCVVETQIKEHFQLDDFGFSCETLASHQDAFQIYPNPAKGSIQLYNYSSNLFSGYFEVVNLSGKRLYNEPFLHVEGFATQEIDISGLQPGAYLIVLQDARQVITKKLVVLR